MKYFRRLSVFILSMALQAIPVLADTSLSLSSPAFKEDGYIPIQYTGEGKDISPPLVWKNVPKDTQTLALICDDPDAPKGPFVHWVVYNIPPTMSGLEAGTQSPDIHLGKNSMGSIGYVGPNPPQDTHHYNFTLYALDASIGLKEGGTKEEVLKEMEGHILAKATLVGLYQLQKKHH